MKQYSFKIIVPAILFGMVLTVPSFAQDAPASTEMHQAGQEIKQVGSDTAAAAKNAYHGTGRAIEDTTITTKVKAAFMQQDVGASGIHVDTVAGHRHVEGQCGFA